VLVSFKVTKKAGRRTRYSEVTAKISHNNVPHEFNRHLKSTVCFNLLNESHDRGVPIQRIDSKLFQRLVSSLSPAAPAINPLASTSRPNSLCPFSVNSGKDRTWWVLEPSTHYGVSRWVLRQQLDSMIDKLPTKLSGMPKAALKRVTDRIQRHGEV